MKEPVSIVRQVFSFRTFANSTMNLALDFGNTTTKAGVFNQRKLLHVETHSTFTEKTAGAILKKFPVEASTLSSVISNTKDIERLLKRKTHFIRLNPSTPNPINNLYRTPRTLGMDRLANVIGAHSLYPKKKVLVISAGTCITYDVITAEGNYFGGNISPGVDMQLKAMHTFTARLPLVPKKMTRELFGRSTAQAMLTGVIKGTAFEMKGFIAAYRKKYPALRVIITGGDASFFVTMLESKIFAVPHLVLHGLNEILLMNYAEKV
jgi:type III pantothenate kinase